MSWIFYSLLCLLLFFKVCHSLTLAIHNHLLTFYFTSTKFCIIVLIHIAFADSWSIVEVNLHANNTFEFYDHLNFFQKQQYWLRVRIQYTGYRMLNIPKPCPSNAANTNTNSTSAHSLMCSVLLSQTGTTNTRLYYYLL